MNNSRDRFFLGNFKLKIIPTVIKDSFIIESDVSIDDAGFIQDFYEEKKYEIGLEKVIKFRKFKLIKNRLNCIRGIHVASFDKILCFISGRSKIVVVDFRPDSVSFMKQFILSSLEFKQIYIPSYCGYAISSEEDSCFLQMQSEGNIEYLVAHNEPNLKIEWKKDQFVLDALYANPLWCFFDCLPFDLHYSQYNKFKEVWERNDQNK